MAREISSRIMKTSLEDLRSRSNWPRPQGHVTANLDELNVDPLPGARSQHRSLDHERGAKLLPDIPKIPRLVLERERRCPGADLKAFDHRQVANHLVGQTVDEQVAIGLRTEVGERNHGDDRRLATPGRHRPVRDETRDDETDGGHANRQPRDSLQAMPRLSGRCVTPPRAGQSAANDRCSDGTLSCRSAP